MLACPARLRQRVSAAAHSLVVFAALSIVATAFAPTASSAQSKVVGKWLVRYEHEVHTGHMGSGPSQIVTDSVHLTLRQKGDSLVGEWQTIPAAGETAAHPRTLFGVIRGETARLEVDPNVQATEGYFAEIGRELMEFLKEHVHGIQPVTTRMELAVRGDSLVGTRWSSTADGATETARRLLLGVREKP